MKKQVLKVSVLFTLGVFTNQQANAQFNVAQFMRGGKDDANKLINAYLSPQMTGMAAAVNNGWYNTAKPHGMGGFDVTVTFSGFAVPDEAKTFDPAALGLTNMKLSATANQPAGIDVHKASTVFGPNKDQPVLDVNSNGVTLGSLPLLAGSDVPYSAALPTAQFSIGIYKGTEVMLRYMPEVTADALKVSMFGFGVKHDIKQWIPKVKVMPFDLSAIFGYSSANADYAIPADSRLKPDNYAGALPASSYENQKVNFKTTGWMLGLIVSKKLGPITPYIGLNYNNSSVDLSLLGKYPVTIHDPNTNTKSVQNVDDPVVITGTANGIRANGGIRIKLLILTIHADYTIAKYNMATVGIGLNLQSIVPFKL